MTEPTTQERLRNRIARPSTLNRKLMEFADTNLMRDALAEIEWLKAQHADCIKCLGDALQDTADISTERDTLAAEVERLMRENEVFQKANDDCCNRSIQNKVLTERLDFERRTLAADNARLQSLVIGLTEKVERGPLSREQLAELLADWSDCKTFRDCLGFARAIEIAHGIGQGGKV